MKNHTDAIVSKLQKIVSPEFCKRLALKTGFVKRSTSRLKGYEFVKALIIGSSENSCILVGGRSKRSFAYWKKHLVKQEKPPYKYSWRVVLLYEKKLA
jgi:hypothetical protein